MAIAVRAANWSVLSSDVELAGHRAGDEGPPLLASEAEDRTGRVLAVPDTDAAVGEFRELHARAIGPAE